MPSATGPGMNRVRNCGAASRLSSVKVTGSPSAEPIAPACSRGVISAGPVSSITPKVLTQRLRQLERDGLVVRTYHPEVPPRVEYEISELGRSLAPLFAALAGWSADNLGKVEQARLAYDAQPWATVPGDGPRRRI